MTTNDTPILLEKVNELQKIQQEQKLKVISDSRIASYSMLAVCLLVIIFIVYTIKNYHKIKLLIIGILLGIIGILGSTLTDFLLFPNIETECNDEDTCVTEKVGIFTYLTSVGVVAIIFFIVYMMISKKFILSGIQQVIPQVVIDALNANNPSQNKIQKLTGEQLSKYIFGEKTTESNIPVFIVFTLCILAVVFSTLYGKALAKSNNPDCKKDCPSPNLKYWIVFANGFIPMLLIGSGIIWFYNSPASSSTNSSTPE